MLVCHGLDGLQTAWSELDLVVMAKGVLRSQADFRLMVVLVIGGWNSFFDPDPNVFPSYFGFI